MKTVHFSRPFLPRRCFEKPVYPARYFIIAVSAWIFCPLTALGGPPFRTDDPEPVEYHHWEFYGATQLANVHGAVSGSVPEVEINFGIFPETQFHVIVPFAFNRPAAGRSAYGPGDVEFGLKYLFVNETRAVPQFGVFPLIEAPAGNVDKGLGSGTTRFFLPLWLQKSWGKWTTYGGGGYSAAVNSDQARSWFLGWEGQRDFLETLTMGAEVFSTIVPSEKSENEVALAIGAIVNFNDSRHFLFSIGKDVLGQTGLFGYAAYLLTIGKTSI